MLGATRFWRTVVAILYYIASLGGLIPIDEGYINTFESQREIVFESISAEEIKLTDEEKEPCENWFRNNLSTTAENYPLDFGSYDSDRMMAMQYSLQDASEGTVLIYKRADVEDDEYTVKLNGLVPSEVYNIYDIDNPEAIRRFTGEELMNKGITLPLPEGEKAIILMFSAQ